MALYLIYRTNLHTNAVIVKRGKEKTWDYPTIGEICAGAKVKPWTAFRCLAMLHNAGFIQNVGRWEGTPGGEVLRTRSTQRIFRDTFFSVIGMAVKLDKEKRARMKEKKYIERNQEKAAAIGLLDGLQDKAYYFAKVIAHLPERLLERIESELQRRRRPA
ncbi:MAG: hypothetical protein OEZ39_20215 [Gammaproteobacteria bacterium]|nr:hypothetical protein [Gammaproteobacteria bacterium]